MKLHHTKYKKNYRNYILGYIEENYKGNKIKTDKDKIAFIFKRFHDECSYTIKTQGKRQAMTEWLAGLAIPFACYNGEVIDLAIEMGSIDNNPTDKMIDKVLEGYFPFMANIILGLENEIGG